MFFAPMIAMIMLPIMISLLVGEVFGVQIPPAVVFGSPLAMMVLFGVWLAYNVWKDKKKENMPQTAILDSLQPDDTIEEMTTTVIVR